MFGGLNGGSGLVRELLPLLFLVNRPNSGFG